MEFGKPAASAREAGVLDRQRADKLPEPDHLSPITPTHVAFIAKSREEVDASTRRRSTPAGRTSARRVRAHYHPNYYGAFVLDPDGHDIEAVFHG